MFISIRYYILKFYNIISLNKKKSTVKAQLIACSGDADFGKLQMSG